MHTTHPIATEPGIASYQLTSFHYGAAGGGKKVYIQASLHADEVPAMLVAHVLRRELERLDAEGRVRGEIMLVPAANPIGLSQVVHGAPVRPLRPRQRHQFQPRLQPRGRRTEDNAAGPAGPGRRRQRGPRSAQQARAAVAGWETDSTRPRT